MRSGFRRYSRADAERVRVWLSREERTACLRWKAQTDPQRTHVEGLPRLRASFELRTRGLHRRTGAGRGVHGADRRVGRGFYSCRHVLWVSKGRWYDEAETTLAPSISTEAAKHFLPSDQEHCASSTSSTSRTLGSDLESQCDGRVESIRGPKIAHPKLPRDPSTRGLRS